MYSLWTYAPQDHFCHNLKLLLSSSLPMNKITILSQLSKVEMDDLFTKLLPIIKSKGTKNQPQ